MLMCTLSKENDYRVVPNSDI